MAKRILKRHQIEKFAHHLQLEEKSAILRKN